MDINEILAILGLLGLGLFFGKDAITKHKNKKALKANEEGNKEIAKKEGILEELAKDLEQERKLREAARKKLQEEQNREISDEELNDFFDNRYNNEQ